MANFVVALRKISLSVPISTPRFILLALPRPNDWYRSVGRVELYPFA